MVPKKNGLGIERRKGDRGSLRHSPLLVSDFWLGEEGKFFRWPPILLRTGFFRLPRNGEELPRTYAFPKRFSKWRSTSLRTAGTLRAAIVLQRLRVACASLSGKEGGHVTGIDNQRGWWTTRNYSRTFSLQLLSFYMSEFGLQNY